MPLLLTGTEAADKKATAGAVMDPAALPGMQPSAVEESAAPAEDAALSEEAAPAEAAESPADAAPVEAVDASPARPASSGGAHTVKKGDTLWGLASEYYQQPFDWKVIWEENKDTIHNPNLIYPDQAVRIPGRTIAAPAAEAPSPAAEEVPETAAEPVAAPEVAVAEPEAVPEPEPAAAPAVKKSAKFQATRNDPNTFLVDSDWKGDGRVISDMAKKILISQNDIIYLNIGTKAGVKPLMRADVYRRSQNVREPDTGKHIGSVVKRVAVIEMTQDIGPTNCSAVVITSYEPIKIGDMVRLKD